MSDEEQVPGAETDAQPQAMTDKITIERETLDITSIDSMCAILKDHLIVASGYTDCAILYQVTFDQLRALFEHGRSNGRAALAAQPAVLLESTRAWSRAIAQEERACRAEDALVDLVNQIRKTSPIDDHGHDLTMNMAYLKAVELLDDPPQPRKDDHGLRTEYFCQPVQPWLRAIRRVRCCGCTAPPTV